jgi:hypothetical protein
MNHALRILLPPELLQSSGFVMGTPGAGVLLNERHAEKRGLQPEPCKTRKRGEAVKMAGSIGSPKMTNNPDCYMNYL